MEDGASKVSVLLVEDDDALAREIRTALAAAGFDVQSADLADVPRKVASGTIALIVMDRMIHGIDSLSILPTMRASGHTPPILFISFLSSVDEKIRGLQAGGDDYLIKPFALGELVARVHVLARRTANMRQTSLVLGDLVIDLIERSVRRGSRRVDLLPREFQLLEYFVRHADQLVSRTMLLEDIWHYKSTIQTNVIDAHIANLRKKINGDGEAKLIKNIRGAGFILSSTP